MRIPLLAILSLCSFPILLRAQTAPLQGNPLFTISVNDKTGYIDQEGKIVLPPIYPNGGEFSEGLAAVRLKGRYGFIDRTGHFVIEPQFDWAEAFSNGLAIVSNQGQPYYIDREGHIPFDCNYAAITSFSQGRAHVTTHSGKEGIIDLQGQWLIDTVYDRVGAFHDGLAVAHIRLKKGKEKIAVIDTLGKVVIRPGAFESINDFNEGYAVVRTKDGTQGLIGRTGRLVFSRTIKNHILLDAKKFNNGIATIRLYKYWIPEVKGVYATSEKAYPGFIDMHNNIVLDDTTVTDIREFSMDRSFVRRRHDGYRMIDNRMQTVGTAKFSSVQKDGFINGYAIVQSAQGWGIVDTNAHFVALTGKEDQDIDGCWIIGRYFFFRTSQDDTARYGITTLHGREIAKPCLDYFDMSGFINGLLKVRLGDRMAWLDTLGRIVWSGTPMTNLPLSNLNIDCMMRGYFYATNIPQRLSGNRFKPNSLGITINTQSVDTFSGSFNGFPVYLYNTTRDTCRFHAENSRLNMKMQALDEEGHWKDIDYLPHSWCGNSYHILALEPGACWKFIIPRYEGEVPTKMRIVLEYIDTKKPKKNKVLYSNTIDGHLNPGQFWTRHPYHPLGLMDPYLD